MGLYFGVVVMINWVDPEIDMHEYKIIKRTLEHAHEVLSNTDSPEHCISLGFMLPLFKDFGKETFCEMISELLRMHEDSENLYYVTDFHFLILHNLLQWAIDNHNASVLQSENPILLNSRYTIDPSEIVERLFHDTDFLLTSDEYNGLEPEERKALQLSDELFSICNNLPPHPSELKVVDKPFKKRRKKPYKI
jgi:hypothetical protein